MVFLYCMVELAENVYLLYAGFLLIQKRYIEKSTQTKITKANIKNGWGNRKRSSRDIFFYCDGPRLKRKKITLTFWMVLTPKDQNFNIHNGCPAFPLRCRAPNIHLWPVKMAIISTFGFTINNTTNISMECTKLNLTPYPLVARRWCPSWACIK